MIICTPINLAGQIQRRSQRLNSDTHVAIGPQCTANALRAAALADGAEQGAPGSRTPKSHDSDPIHHWSFVHGLQLGCKVGRSIQAGAALALSVSQQAFKHAAGFRVTRVIPARVHHLVKSQSATRASAIRSVMVIVWRGGKSSASERARSAHALNFIVVSPSYRRQPLIKFRLFQCTGERGRFRRAIWYIASGPTLPKRSGRSLVVLQR